MEDFEKLVSPDELEDYVLPDENSLDDLISGDDDLNEPTDYDNDLIVDDDSDFVLEDSFDDEYYL